MRRALISGCAMFRQRSRADRVTIQSIYSYCSLGLSGLLLDTVMRVSLQVQGHFPIVTEQPLCDRQVSFDSGKLLRTYALQEIPAVWSFHWHQV